MDNASPPNRRYPRELKAEVIRLVQEEYKSVVGTAEAFHVSPASVYRWLAETNGPSLRLRQRALQRFTDEIKRLEDASARLEDERNLLVRTVQIFARMAT